MISLTLQIHVLHSSRDTFGYNDTLCSVFSDTKMYAFMHFVGED